MKSRAQPSRDLPGVYVVASGPPKTQTKSWAVRVFVGLGVMGMFFVMQVLIRSKGAGFRLGASVEEGPTLQVQIPDGLVVTPLRSPASPTVESQSTLGALTSGAAASVVSYKPTDKQIESGLYRPDTSRSLEHYAGAWLVSKKRLLDSKGRVVRMKSLEGASFSVAGLAAHQDSRIALMTRDYFDFSVQHLSSTTNQLPWNAPETFLDVIHEQTINIVERLRARAESPKEHPTHVSPLSEDPRRKEQTVALIPFCNRAASVDSRLETAWNNAFQVKVRLLFFQATFWSVYRAFPNIVVTVGTDSDLATLMEMNLPVWKTVNMKALFNESAPIRAPGSVHFLPRESLLFLMEKMVDSSAQFFSKFRYVYYTEADHILQLRSADQLYNAIDNSGGRWALAPHRLQTIALPRLYPDFKHLWKTNKWQDHLVESLQDKRVIIEHEDPLGSCCDDGRFYFAPCGNWWYNCPEWGLRNFTDWMRFGTQGYSLPTGTEHGARCLYSEMRKLCPVPIKCPARVPNNDKEICPEVPRAEKTWEWDAKVDALKQQEQLKKLQKEQERQRERDRRSRNTAKAKARID